MNTIKKQKLKPDVALKRLLGVVSNLYPVGKSTIYGGDMRIIFIIEGEVKVISFLTGFTKRFFDYVLWVTYDIT